MSLYLATFATFETTPVCLSVSIPQNLCNPCNHTCLSLCICTLQPFNPCNHTSLSIGLCTLEHLKPYLSVYTSLYLATFPTLPNIPVSLSVSVPCYLCKHTCLSICLCTSQVLQPYLSVYISLYLATYATSKTIPLCLSVSVHRNLCNVCNHTCLSISLCTSQPLQTLQPYLSVYLSL